jgi:post-segregation antitoxin (ccd killing protein)
MFGCMPKMQVYLPDALYDDVKRQAARLNVSGILQDALATQLAELARRDALDEALRSYQAESSPFTDAELASQAAADRQQAVYAKGKPKRRSAA